MSIKYQGTDSCMHTSLFLIPPTQEMCISTKAIVNAQHIPLFSANLRDQKKKTKLHSSVQEHARHASY